MATQGGITATQTPNVEPAAPRLAARVPGRMSSRVANVTSQAAARTNRRHGAAKISLSKIVACPLKSLVLSSTVDHVKLVTVHRSSAMLDAVGHLTAIISYTPIVDLTHATFSLFLRPKSAWLLLM
jgi:hypothetical protein